MTKILAFGTFDYFHYGHLQFLEEARSLAADPYLVVSVALDQNVKKIKNQLPQYNQEHRIALLSVIKIIDQVVLGAEQDYIQHIISISPDIIVLGYDQAAYTEDLSDKLYSKSFSPRIVRLSSHNPDQYKTSLYKKTA